MDSGMPGSKARLIVFNFKEEIIMKKTLLPLLLAFVLLLAGCVKTKSDVAEKPSSDSKSGGNASEQVEIEVLGMSSGEADLNIVRDQLVKNGFNVKLNIQPDYGSFKAQQDAGNFDVALSSWTTVTGNPDYAVRSLFKSGGDYSIMADPEIDKLIDKASTQTAKDYVKTYKELEQRLVFDKAYIAPLYISLKTQAVNKDVLNPKSVRLSKILVPLLGKQLTSTMQPSVKRSRLFYRKRCQPEHHLTPLRAMMVSINMINTNMYVRLINLTDDDKITADGSLSRNYSIADGKMRVLLLIKRRY